MSQIAAADEGEVVMIPIEHVGDVYVNRLLVARLFRSNGRPRSRDLGFAMWSYNGQPLGWIGDGCYLIECVAAALLLDGKFTPWWESVQTGMRLIHPRYTLAVDRTASGWRPSILDNLNGRSHSLKVQGTSTEAIKLLDELLRRRVGREKPSFELERSLAEFEESSLQLQLALSSGLLNIAGLIRNEIIKQYHWSEVQSGAVLNLARLLDTYSSPGLDPLPLLATTLATYIKSALIDVYRGADSIFLGGACCSLVFSTEELVAFRDRFRRSPMTDEEYLDLVDKHFVTPIRALRRKHRLAKSSTSRLKPLHPRRDRGDFLMEWPLPPGTRPFEVEQLPRALNLAA